MTVRTLCLATSLLLVLAACSPNSDPAGGPPPLAGEPSPGPFAQQAPQAPDAAPAAASAITAEELSGVVDAVCSGANNCRAGDLDVELLPTCGADGFFAAVTAPQGVELGAKPNGPASEARARIGTGQLVCIQAIAREGQEPRAYFVTAIRAADFPGCATTSLCERYGERAVQWQTTPEPGTPCRQLADGRFEGCAQGWLPAGDLDVFSNG